ncbi:uncharacterized protein LAESUDRAFT_488513 [Laetiporus sulphureus 93-53]|uniref:Secreted protein n=1 Tax=Laetiporus sulphureus 93-53 TaxID=1314785 RepID=A0A165BJW3_9APHY|nr:uncharacterized protein LAESUDRAFT_488513 [Laetiporus sulphureus 93-53]KZT01196.1 hypothetical protein LAESUDRAFT_488513 [Laetiporus sulphureus 93-53]
MNGLLALCSSPLCVLVRASFLTIWPIYCCIHTHGVSSCELFRRCSRNILGCSNISSIFLLHAISHMFNITVQCLIVME